MAILQGICKNCGSLVVYNSSDDTCDCIFCNAVFPVSEVIPMDAELKDIEFPNEKFEKKAGIKTQYATMPDSVTPAVKRNKVSNTTDENAFTKQFEIQAKDVKAPKKVVILLSVIAAAALIIVVSISLPLYFKRTKLLSSMEGKMPSVVENVATVDTTKGKGYPVGYSIQGLDCQNVSIVTGDDIDEDTAKLLFDNYCDARKSVSSQYGKDDVKMKVYAKKGVYNVSSSKTEFTENKTGEKPSKKK